jgi:spore germination protein
MVIYVVKAGDTLFTIANEFGVAMDSVISDNQLSYPGRLVVGQSLVIAPSRAAGTADPGDTAHTAARRFHLPPQTPIGANPGVSSAISPGQLMYIPHETAPGRRILVNGYGYTHISPETFDETAPFLSRVSIFSYNIRGDGSLVAPGDTALIARAGARGVKPVMVVANLDENHQFSTELASAVLQSDAARNLLLQNILRIMQQKGYTGLDVDFEYVSGADRPAYNRFLEKAANMLRPLGYTLSTAVPAKTRANQPGLLYEGVEYRAHGRVVDFMLLMTYDWGYRYGPPMAVSPYHLMEEVVRYAISEVPAEKLLLGMPNYGYDWALPYAPGEAAGLVHNARAVDMAALNQSNIRFDAQSQTPYFNYAASGGRRHVVWFDDAASFKAKLGLVGQYNLGGIGYWNINTLFKQGWLVLGAMYAI